MTKCEECPWKDRLNICMTSHCEEHDKDPIKSFVEEIRQLEYELEVALGEDGGFWT